MARTPRRSYGGSNIPSQAPSDYVPYAPDIQPDLSVTEDMRGVKPSGYPARGNFVLAVYDSRLPQTIDFDTELSSRVSDSDAPINRSDVTFVVPQGRTLVIKNFSVAVDQQLNGSSSPTNNVNLTGFNSNTIEAGNPFFPVISILIDGTPVPNYSDINLFDLTIGYHKFESFILVRGGSTVTLRCVFAGTAGDNTPHRSYWRLYGNELLTVGDDITQETTNTEAVPVKAGFFSRLASALERLAK